MEKEADMAESDRVLEPESGTDSIIVVGVLPDSADKPSEGWTVVAVVNVIVVAVFPSSWTVIKEVSFSGNAGVSDLSNKKGMEKVRVCDAIIDLYCAFANPAEKSCKS